MGCYLSIILLRMCLITPGLLHNSGIRIMLRLKIDTRSNTKTTKRFSLFGKIFLECASRIALN